MKGAAGLQELVSTWMTTDPYQTAVDGEDGRLLPQHVPADGLHPDRGLQAAAAAERRLRLRRQHAQRRRRRVPAARAEPAGQLRAHRLAAGEGRPPVHGDADDDALPDDDRAQEPLRPDRDAGRHQPALDVDDRPELDDRLLGHRDPDRAGADQHGLQRRGARRSRRRPTTGNCRGSATVATRRVQGDVGAVPAPARLHAAASRLRPTRRSATTTRRSRTSRRTTSTTGPG